MERLTNIEQLKENKAFVIIDGADVKKYEFLCIHPHNNKYILALEVCSQEGQKLYIPQLLGETSFRGQVFVGKYDSKFICQKLIEYHQKKVDFWTKRLNEED